MALTDIRIIVATKDFAFYSSIRKELMAERITQMIINVLSCTDIEKRLARNGCNILIVDIDTSTDVNALKLKGLSDNYGAHVILTANNQIRALPYVSKNVKDFFVKPTGDAKRFVTSVSASIDDFLRRTTRTSYSQRPAPSQPPQAPTSMPYYETPQKAQLSIATTHTKLVAIASSTGGTEALEKVFRQIPANCPPMLVVQHMSTGFTKLFAERLNKFYPMTVKEAEKNDYVRSGQILIAPADSHMVLIKRGEQLLVDCFTGQKLHGVMPAADILFDSVATIMRHNAVGVVLTGMGEDGGRGLLQMHNLGAKTIGQDQKTSVVYGMPKVAYTLGAVDYQLPIDEIGRKIMTLSR